MDYKICSKALSIRPSKVLDKVISPDQTCSVPGQSISSNLTFLRDMLLNLWKSRSLSMIGKSLIINNFICGVSKLLYLARVLERYNKLIWPFLWGSKIETVARKALHCPIAKGGLGIIDFEIKGQALRLASALNTVDNLSSNSFYLAKYFCGSRLAHFHTKWTNLRDNSSPNASLP